MVTSANSWVKFFKDAGVPSAASATYAHIFYENRMELDMLTDLNKEYLREMGITPMGDIISILRHAKKVYDQNTRDRILSSEKLSITTASVSPLVASKVTKINLVDGDEKMEVSPTPSKPPRRVLPEHEGPYKVTLPSGTTERSKLILAKRADLYSEKKPAGIFDRLQQSKPSASQKIQRIKVTTANKPVASSSIFDRLGGKDEDDDLENPAFAGMIRSGPKKLIGVKKPTKTQPKVMVVKKIPAKAATMVADEYQAREKSVKFSTMDEILEIESRQQALASRNNKRIFNLNEALNVKARLGLNRKPNQISLQQNAALLHRTKKIVRLKQPVVKRANGQILKVSHLKSDEEVKPVKSRLLLKRRLGDGGTIQKIAERVGRVSLKQRLGKTTARDSSVFDRLGFNKK